MADEMDIEAMLEAPYKKKEKASSSRNGNKSDSGDASDEERSRRHKKKSKRSRGDSRERSLSRERIKKRRDRSRSAERRKSPDSRRRRRSRSPEGRSEKRRGSYANERDRDTDRDRERNRERDRERERDRDRNRDRDRERDREREKERERNRRSRDVSPIRKPRYSSPGDENKREREIQDENLSAEERDARTVFIMQLARNVTIRDIMEFFSKVGQVVDVRLISDRNSRRSKGIGYVEFTDKSAVPLGINLSGQKLLGVPIMVQPTMAEKNRAAASALSLSRPTGPTRLYVGSLHYNITEAMLKAIFEPFGAIDAVQLIYDTESGRSKGYGFVTFREADSAKRALDQLNGFELAGRPMKVGHVTERSDGSMSFLDDEETEKGGIEMNAASRAALMQKLAATHAVGMQVPSAPLVPAVLQTPLLQSQILPQPSSCVMVSNMFDPDKENEPGWDDDIKNDVLEEASRIGNVVHIHVDSTDPEGRVYVKCALADTANGLIQTLNGRWFAGRHIKAEIMPQESYHTLFPYAATATAILKPGR
eukprot:gene19139-21056_t